MKMKHFTVSSYIFIFLLLLLVVYTSCSDIACIKCGSYDECGEGINETTLCTAHIGALSLGAKEKAVVDKIIESFGEAALDSCVTVTDEGMEFRGCAPGKLNEKDFCEELKEKAPTAKCEICTAVALPCNVQPPSKPDDENSVAPHTISLNFTLYFFMLSSVLFKLVL